MEGINIDINQCRKIKIDSVMWMMIGEFWQENDGDLILLSSDFEDEKIYYYNHAVKPLSIKPIADNFIQFIEYNLVSFINTQID